MTSVQPAFANPFVNLPQLSRSLAFVIGFLYVAGLLIGEPLTRFLALIPGFTAGGYFWNVFTAAYFDTSLLSTAGSVVLVLLVGKWLEPLWGSREFLRFVVIVNALSGLATFVLLIVLFALSRSESLWFKSLFTGFAAAIAGFAVAAKQLLPEHPLRLFGAVALRAKYLPAVLVVWELICVVLLGLSPKSLPFTLFGVLFSWLYLRFYQVKDRVVGDLSDAFSFASFFPDPLQRPVGVAAIIVWNLLVAMRLCSPLSASGGLLTTGDDSAGGRSMLLDTRGGEFSNDPDSERRRAWAVKAVESRLGLVPTPKNALKASDVSHPNTDEAPEPV